MPYSVACGGYSKPDCFFLQSSHRTTISPLSLILALQNKPMLSENSPILYLCVGQALAATLLPDQTADKFDVPDNVTTRLRQPTDIRLFFHTALTREAA